MTAVNIYLVVQRRFIMKTSHLSINGSVEARSHKRLLKKGKLLAAALPLISSVMLLSVWAEPASAAGFPAASCRTGLGYRQAGPRLCIDENVQNAVVFNLAIARCRNKFGYVASYGDLFYLYINTGLDASYNPNGKWLGPDVSADDEALVGNRDITFDADPDGANFEGTANKQSAARGYWCAHDDDQ
jgi:hypothetical protein